MKYIYITLLVVLVVGFQNCSDDVRFSAVTSNDKQNDLLPLAGDLQIIAHKDISLDTEANEFDYYSDSLYITILHAEPGMLACLEIINAFSVEQDCDSDPRTWEGFKWDHFVRDGSTLRLVTHNLGNWALEGSRLLEPNRTYKIVLYNPIAQQTAATDIRVIRLP